MSNTSIIIPVGVVNVKNKNYHQRQREILQTIFQDSNFRKIGSLTLFINVIRRHIHNLYFKNICTYEKNIKRTF